MPFWLLYLVSDGLYFILYYVIGYRKKVVLENLKNSFPEKSPDEIKKICKEYFRYLCDLVLETLKTLTISKEAMMKRCTMNPDSIKLMKKLYSEKKNLVLVVGHYGNWEWGGACFSYNLDYKLYVIYKPLANKHFDKLIYKMRSRPGTGLIAFKDVLRSMIKHKDHLNVTAFIADQTPHPESAYWTTFLNQDTPVFVGTEKIAQKLDYPVVYSSLKKIKRGYYILSIDMLFEQPKNTSEGEITIAHTKKLEKEINAYPPIWLWSHKRWKHKRN